MTKVVERPQAKTLARAVTSLTIYHLATTSFFVMISIRRLIWPVNW